MVIVILMAGMGTRTKDVDVNVPKPLLRIHGIPMIDWVVHNFLFAEKSDYIFVVQKKDNQKFKLADHFNIFNINYHIVELDGPTEGAAVSAMRASMFYQDSELLIINSDQYLTLDMNKFISAARKSDCSGMIMTMNASGPKWSYVKLNEENLVIEVAEKKEISQVGTTGAYWFRSGQDFLDGVTEMVNKNDRTKNEFYLAPVYNYLIKNNKKILSFNINEHNASFYGLGTSEDINIFIENSISLSLSRKIKF